MAFRRAIEINPSMADAFNGLGCGVYHIDSEEALRALADKLNEITDKYNKGDKT